MGYGVGVPCRVCPLVAAAQRWYFARPARGRLHLACSLALFLVRLAPAVGRLLFPVSVTLVSPSDDGGVQVPMPSHSYSLARVRRPRQPVLPT